MKTVHALFILGSLSFALGCFGNLKADTSKRLARKQLEGPNCKPKDIKTTLVRVIDERPSGIDYLSEVHAEGCGRSEDFLCALSGNNWACEPMKK